MKKIEGHVPLAIWTRYEKWAEERGKIQMRQLLTALFKLFLNAPDHMKVLALYGREEDIFERPPGQLSEKECDEVREIMGANLEAASKLDQARAVLRGLTPAEKAAIPRQVVELLPWSPTDEEAKFRAAKERPEMAKGKKTA